MNNETVLSAAIALIDSKRSMSAESPFYVLDGAKHEALSAAIFELESARSRLNNGKMLVAAHVAIERAFMDEERVEIEQKVDACDELALACYHELKYAEDGRKVLVIKPPDKDRAFCFCEKEVLDRVDALLR